MNLFLERPLVFFDLETTGTDVAKDRIISIAGKKYMDGSGSTDSITYLKRIVNPGIPILAASSIIHGFNDAFVKELRPFNFYAGEILKFCTDCDLAGFNLLNFDVPLLWEEFARAGKTWNLDDVNIIDAGNIFKKKEPRTLAAGLKFYCNRDHAEAHEAQADVEATADVLFAQLQRYDDLKPMTVAEVASFSRMDDRIDLAGKFVRNEKGEAIYNFGKHKGSRVKDEIGFLAWMRGKDFTSNTLIRVERMLAEMRGGL